MIVTDYYGFFIIPCIVHTICSTKIRNSRLVVTNISNELRSTDLILSRYKSFKCLSCGNPLVA